MAFFCALGGRGDTSSISTNVFMPVMTALTLLSFNLAFSLAADSVLEPSAGHKQV